MPRPYIIIVNHTALLSRQKEHVDKDERCKKKTEEGQKWERAKKKYKCKSKWKDRITSCLCQQENLLTYPSNNFIVVGIISAINMVWPIETVVGESLTTLEKCWKYERESSNDVSSHWITSDERVNFPDETNEATNDCNFVWRIKSIDHR